MSAQLGPGRHPLFTVYHFHDCPSTELSDRSIGELDLFLPSTACVSAPTTGGVLTLCQTWRQRTDNNRPIGRSRRQINQVKHHIRYGEHLGRETDLTAADKIT